MKRRHFLVAASAAASQSWAGANDRVRLAIIGVGSRGSTRIREILPVANVEIATIVDVDGCRTEAAASTIFQKTSKRPKLESDMRRVFVDKDIDAVTIATTNHWHSLTCPSPKSASADMSLRGNAFITVMQTAEVRDLDDPSDTRNLPRKWTLLVEAQMGPRSVVVSKIRSQGSLEMPGVQDHEMVQAVSSYGADQAFGVRILPGTLGGGEYFFHVQ